jgi:hypothetical protein
MLQLVRRSCAKCAANPLFGGAAQTCAPRSPRKRARISRVHVPRESSPPLRPPARPVLPRAPLQAKATTDLRHGYFLLVIGRNYWRAGRRALHERTKKRRTSSISKI